jgi:hypothetical protein
MNNSRNASYSANNTSNKNEGKMSIEKSHEKGFKIANQVVVVEDNK